MSAMSTATQGQVPALTLGWRMKMSLGDMAAGDMAAALGVNRTTISRWMGDKGAPPKRAYLLQRAMLTGTNSDWLINGWAPWDSNPQPTDWGRRSRRGQSPLGAAA